jgi:ABC-type uncharacterized transport system permease subunit
MNPKLSAWLKSPTTIHGIAALVGTGAGAIAGTLTGHSTIGATTGLIVGGIVAIAMPDNTSEVKPVEQFVNDAVNAAVAGALRQRLPLLLGDASAILAPLIVQGAPAAPAPALQQFSAAGPAAPGAPATT